MKAWIATACLFILLSTPAQAAGNTGSIRIVGRVSPMVSLQFHASSLHGEGVRGWNAGANGVLDFTLDLDDVSVVPARDNGMRGGEVTLALRTNARYVLTATVQGTGFREGTGEIGLADIGFGIPSTTIRPSGDRARSDNTLVHDAARLDSDPLTVPVVGGRPRFHATLADLTGRMVPVLQGERISYGGTANAPNNALLVSTSYAVYPQAFWTSGRFEAVVTYTLATP